jgi:POT family proton-dependent oligopeptide transporter
VQILLIACKSRFRLSTAEPEEQASYHNKVVPWTSSFVGEIRRGLQACRVLMCFVIFWLCYNQTTNNIVSQAGQMVQRGISNDTIQAFNPIACIIMGPIIQSVVFPFLRRRRIPLGPILRITLGFFFIASGIAYAAGIQQLIYANGPCFRYPLECPAAAEESRKLPNNVSVWLQTPLHVLLAIGEILSLVALNEFTYSEAPKDTKSVLQAFQVFSAAAGSALGMTLGPVSKNPFLLVLFSCLAGTMTLTMIPFWLFFRRFDAGKSETSSHQNLDD